MDDPKKLVPEGAVLIGANYHPKTGNLSHTLLMHDSVDPVILERIVLALPKMPVTRIRARKIQLPPKKKGDSIRSYRHRLVIRPSAMHTTLKDEDLARRIADVVLAKFLGDVRAAGQRMET